MYTQLQYHHQYQYHTITINLTQKNRHQTDVSLVTTTSHTLQGNPITRKDDGGGGWRTACLSPHFVKYQVIAKKLFIMNNDNLPSRSWSLRNVTKSLLFKSKLHTYTTYTHIHTHTHSLQHYNTIAHTAYTHHMHNYKHSLLFDFCNRTPLVYTHHITSHHNTTCCLQWWCGRVG